MKKVLVLLVAGCLALSANAARVRDAEGKPCLDYERTVRNDQGEAVMCRQAGGPAVTAEVVIDGATAPVTLKLGEDEDEVTLPASAFAGEGDKPVFVLTRNFDADPRGRVFFFGRQKVVGMTTAKAGQVELSLPVVHVEGVVLGLISPAPSSVSFEQRITGGHRFNVVLRESH